MGNRAFTLIELLAVLILIAMIFGVSLPLFLKFTENINLDTATRTATSVLRTARSFAISGNQDHYVIFDNTVDPHQFFIYDGTEIVEKIMKASAGVYIFKGDSDTSYPSADAIEFTSAVTVDATSYTNAACFTPTGKLDEEADRSLYFANGNSENTPSRCNRITVNSTTGHVGIFKNENIE
ncbi:MAG: prepilin-type N-terminal cleavage/methylation domain-containing protein [Candidatus Omnitrophica bacterium]|nr:prepilin-type N-terminal cleavage/methylation domain-containing protein [Candidatus Omnitrophota bacterium]